MRTQRFLVDRVFGTAFATVITGIGLILLIYLVLPALLGRWRTRDLVQVPATIDAVTVDLIPSRGAPRPTLHVQYHYEVDGRRYQSDRLSLFRESNMELHQFLRDALEHRSSVPVFIDPTRPSFSVVDRTFVALPFCWVAALSIALCWSGINRLSKRPWADSSRLIIKR